MLISKFPTNRKGTKIRVTDKSEPLIACSILVVWKIPPAKSMVGITAPCVAGSPAEPVALPFAYRMNLWPGVSPKFQVRLPMWYAARYFCARIGSVAFYVTPEQTIGQADWRADGRNFNFIYAAGGFADGASCARAFPCKGHRKSRYLGPGSI